ncbi:MULTISPECIES: putative metalloprotease CJM1_0395 family protein [Thiomicrorhabdus]|uniref:Catalase n=1 Tax=Thiomicrorhabdus heinhorstiae TaxID=2748010 RepID=A0ABS0C0S9_9GAMM|nr:MULTISPECIES: putative metalloprotease CJM1_0395 family protein [Thiomicrorhabdus]MBF6057841.1 hypothetical protein [Thiomicrorhabdus heinhorstiae]
MGVQSVEQAQAAVVAYNAAPQSISPATTQSNTANSVGDGKRENNAFEVSSRDSNASSSNGQAHNLVSKAQADSDLQQSREVEQVLTQLKARDLEVRAHEAAHLNAAGGHARGGMSFSYQTGPDGQKYAVGGEVGIDTSPVAGDPQKTLDKARQIQAAAMAPAQPSSQDFRVAAQAIQMQQQALVEMRQMSQEEAGMGERNGFEARLSVQRAEKPAEA